jgi:hypothetical protein
MSAVWFNCKYRYTLSTSRVIMLSLVKWKYRHTLYHSSVVVLSFVNWTYKHTALNNGVLILHVTWDRGISTWLYHWSSNEFPVLEEFAALCVGNLKYRKIDILASHFTYSWVQCPCYKCFVVVKEEFAALCVGNFKYRTIDNLFALFTYINTYHTLISGFA